MYIIKLLDGLPSDKRGNSAYTDQSLCPAHADILVGLRQWYIRIDEIIGQHESQYDTDTAIAQADYDER